ncbi:hypothetical protein EGD17_05665 [Salmonella enterica]|nr:hypothetical protein [Salmonella enterica]
MNKKSSIATLVSPEYKQKRESLTAEITSEYDDSKKNNQRVNRLQKLIDDHGIETVAKRLNVTEIHIKRNLLTGRSAINLVKLMAAERQFGA